ncbi:Multidrug resistance-associated protein 1 [Halocaridina rubra]|uniref:Multidrug resistance-associated protein 1 n=1 Tax=Halocaridina rubra TaxID=373956 RepID=A0AAN8ZPL3_HALRR
MDVSEPAWHGYFYVILLFASTSLTTIVKNISFYIDLTIGNQVQSSVMSAVYRKAMMLSNTARRESTLGEIVNLMAIDSQRLRDALLYLNIATGAPFVVSIALYQLWQLFGPSSLAGVLVLILLIPVNSFVANKIKLLQTVQMNHKDRRIKLLAEIINGIKASESKWVN